MGGSRIEPNKVKHAQRVLERCESRGVTVLLPTDHVIAETLSADAETQTVAEIPDGMMGLDIGPETVATYANAISDAGTIFWNGPMGVFEIDQFSNGTKGVAEAVAAAKGYSVIGGGDSAAAVSKFELADKVSHVSTGGGASLAFVEGSPLPGIRAISERRN